MMNAPENIELPSSSVTLLSAPIVLIDGDYRTVNVALIVVGGANDASRELEDEMKNGFRYVVSARGDTKEYRIVKVIRHDNLKDWASVVELVYNSDAIVILFNQKPAVYVQPLLLLTMKRRVSTRGVQVYVVDNIASRTQAGETNPLDLLQHPKVLDHIRSVVKLTKEDDQKKFESLVAEVRAGIEGAQDPASHASTGEAFAWNFATTFLCLIVPNLETRITEALYDGDHLSESKLSSVGIQLPPERIIVLKKYFVLAPDRLGQDVSPDALFPGCVKTGILSFDGLGYQRKVFIYLMELNQRTPSGQTHAVIFADWASPIFLMRDMSVEASQGLDIAEVREEMFSQFKEALKIIIYHPYFPRLLFSNPESHISTEQSSKVALVEVASKESLKMCMNNESRSFVAQPQPKNASLGGMAFGSKFSMECANLHDLLVAMSSSLSNQTDALKMALDSRLPDRYELSAVNDLQFDHLQQFWRILLVLSPEDLGGTENNKVTAAAEKMSMTGKCCVSVIIVGDFGVGIEAVHDVLPDRLRCLPYCCVAGVRTLTGDNVEGRLPFGQQLRTLADVIDGLRLAEVHCLRVEEVFPLMSMARVLTANICCGFVDKMEEYMRDESADESQLAALPFDKPYFIVLPASNRFPDQSALELGLADLRAQKNNESFMGSNGRPYNYQVWHWQHSRLAFEIPGQFSYLREQLNWGFAGLISPQQVDDILEEFGRGLVEHCRNHRFVKTVRWSYEQEGAAGLLQLLKSLRHPPLKDD